jgi:hypothetical protein
MLSRPSQPLRSDSVARPEVAAGQGGARGQRLARVAGLVLAALVTFVGVESTARAHAANGAACVAPTDCTSNFCVDGVCCNTACGGDGSDCQACSVAAGGAVDGTCGPRAVGLACAAANACILTASCAAGGVCAPVTMKTCSALDQCHDVGICDPGTGICNNPVKLNGSTCTDNNACTTGDSCQAGVCTVAATITCAAPDQCHDATTCNTTTGACVYPVKADGTLCNDSNLCTGTDTCVTGVCTGTAPLTCTALDQCHIPGTCNPTTGACSNPPKADGTACNDGTMCTTSDACTGGACGGMQLNCNDGNACTQDTCVGSVGCVNTMIPMCGMTTPDAAAPDAAADAADAQPDGTTADTASTDAPADTKVDVASADAVVDGKVDGTGDTGASDVTSAADATTPIADAAAPRADAARDVGRPVAVGGGGGCDCNLNRGPLGRNSAPLQATLLCGVGLLWLARRRRR